MALVYALLRWIWLLPRRILVLLIRGYQKTLSPDHGLMKDFFPGGYCKYEPTCSQYAREVIMKYGFWRGSYKSVVRIFKCNPCSKGGYDPP